MEFEWDERKNAANFKKHEVWFEEAQTTWADEHAIEFFDPEHSEAEDRFIRIGHSSDARLLLVVYCERGSGDRVRIVSARRVTAPERWEYE